VPVFSLSAPIEQDDVGHIYHALNLPLNIRIPNLEILADTPTPRALAVKLECEKRRSMHIDHADPRTPCKSSQLRKRPPLPDSINQNPASPQGLYTVPQFCS
jgi:hypothetical protein